MVSFLVIEQNYTALAFSVQIATLHVSLSVFGSLLRCIFIIVLFYKQGDLTFGRNQNQPLMLWVMSFGDAPPAARRGP